MLISFITFTDEALFFDAISIFAALQYSYEKFLLFRSVTLIVNWLRCSDAAGCCFRGLASLSCLRPPLALSADFARSISQATLFDEID